MNPSSSPIIEHHGYYGSVEADLEAGLLHGSVQGLNAVVHYEATTLKDLEAAFRDSVEDYLEMCAEAGDSPEKPYSGKYMARLGEDLHRRAAARAAAEGVSLNELTRRALEREVQTGGASVEAR